MGLLSRPIGLATKFLHRLSTAKPDVLRACRLMWQEYLSKR